MVILTCANIDICPDRFGIWYRGFSFKDVIQKTVRKSEQLGYKPVVYDLGELGIGKPFKIRDKNFLEKGYYSVKVKKGYKSRSLFKPSVVLECLTIHNDLTVYLDGDAQLVDSIDEIATDDYDVGVTLRSKHELSEEWYRKLFDIVKFVNAGVIFFYPTLATLNFIRKWEKRTNELGNDQMALNDLICPETYPTPYETITINGVRVKFFPCEKYNYYYFDRGLKPNIKILHFKGMYRHYFPFNWKKRLYCATVVPVLYQVGKIFREIQRHFREK